jgi:hypothetical protein
MMTIPKKEKVLREMPKAAKARPRGNVSIVLSIFLYSD